VNRKKLGVQINAGTTMCKTQLDSGIRAAKKMRLPCWGVLFVIMGSLPAFWLFDHAGKFDIALPSRLLTLASFNALRTRSPLK
jgi:hypothetical protein